MKQSLLLFAAIVYCALFTITRAESLLKQDSSDLFTLTQWSAMRKLEQPILSTKQVTQKTQSKLWWGSDIWDWVTQPFRPVWGWYEEGNNRVDAPYTTFLSAYDEAAF